MSGDDIRFPRWEFNPGQLNALIAEYGYDDPADFERACHLREGRLAEYAANGWQPFPWEYMRMSLVLDIALDDLFSEVYDVVGEG